LQPAGSWLCPLCSNTFFSRFPQPTAASVGAVAGYSSASSSAPVAATSRRGFKRCRNPLLYQLPKRRRAQSSSETQQASRSSAETQLNWATTTSSSSTGDISSSSGSSGSSGSSSSSSSSSHSSNSNSCKFDLGHDESYEILSKTITTPGGANLAAASGGGAGTAAPAVARTRDATRSATNYGTTNTAENGTIAASRLVADMAGEESEAELDVVLHARAKTRLEMACKEPNM
jgi:hypothetical protein